ncbi:hypothetical protein EPI10_001490 [Gossypium australe]|uniref:Uncharacterized protein n=1 Tax=Gossypium australe TaxID=47621 RepID=A0A5B6VBM2_9ROSI|nr:hypothetical protein EPI10_001490 [Gossypium australe]
MPYKPVFCPKIHFSLSSKKKLCILSRPLHPSARVRSSGATDHMRTRHTRLHGQWPEAKHRFLSAFKRLGEDPGGDCGVICARIAA